MPETYTINPLSKESDKKDKEYDISKEEPDAARDMAMCCLTYLFCCIPVLLGSELTLSISSFKRSTFSFKKSIDFERVKFVIGSEQLSIIGFLSITLNIVLPANFAAYIP